MEQPTAQRRPPPSSSALRELYVVILLGVLSFLAIYQQQPPAVAPADAPPAEFSAARALGHIKVIAREPHPTGSPENARVREYIISQLRALGLDPQVQTTTVTRHEAKWGNRPAIAATVSNIAARIPGVSHTQAVMLVAHYDSVPSGPGASDDGSGVATLLETARALKAGPAHLHDVILLFTDGEELGLLGAKAFADEHPWAKDVAVVLNFEARGACGPSFMFETSPHNGFLIHQFAQAAPHPVASSLMYDFYKRMPNDTDFTVFKRVGMAGLNFAYAGCWPRYHTMRDDVQNLDARSLQHDGSYALALTRHFDDLDLNRTTGPDAVFFSVFTVLFHYSQGAVISLLVVTLLLFAGVVALGREKRQLTWSGMLAGFLGLLAGAVIAASASEAAWRILRGAGLASLLPYGIAYNGDLYVFACLALTVAVVSGVFVWLANRFGVGSLAVGALAWWALGAIAASVRVPGGSYLFSWPLLVSLLELGYAFLRRDPEAEEESALVWTLPAIVGIFLFVPILDDLVMLLSTHGLVILAVAMAVLVGFLFPQLHILSVRRRWLVPGGALAVAVVFFVVGMARSGYDAAHPRADSVFYVLNADTGKAVWASADAHPDEWTKQFLTAHPRRGNLDEFLPRAAGLREADAPAVPLAPPEVSRAEDVTLGGVRVLRLQVTSPRGARVAWMRIQDAKVLEADVNGKKIGSAGGNGGGSKWGLVYVGMPKEGIVLTLRVPASQTPSFEILDQSDGLPVIASHTFRPRPADLMPAPSRPDSVTWVSKTYRLDVNAPIEMHHH